MLRIVVIIAGGLAFFWLVVMRLLAKVGGCSRCPYALAWTVDNPLRRWYTGRVLERMDIRPGERVLELGSGPGAFTVDAARRVGSAGWLIAVDVQLKMIVRVKERVRRAGLTHVEVCVADACRLPLSDQSVDRAYLITVLPEISDPVRALTELHRVLRTPPAPQERPSDVLSITEEFLSPTYPLARTVVRWTEEAGFELKMRPGRWWIYTLNFGKA